MQRASRTSEQAPHPADSTFVFLHIYAGNLPIFYQKLMYQPGMAAAAAAASPKCFLYQSPGKQKLMYQPGMAVAAAAASPKCFLYQPGIAQEKKADVSTGTGGGSSSSQSKMLPVSTGNRPGKKS